MQRDTTSTTRTAIATAMPAFAPVLRPPAIACGGADEVGVDIMAVGVREKETRCCVFEESSLILSGWAAARAVGAGSARDDGGRITGVRMRVVVMSVLMAGAYLARRTSEGANDQGRERLTTVLLRKRSRTDGHESEKPTSNMRVSLGLSLGLDVAALGRRGWRTHAALAGD